MFVYIVLLQKHRLTQAVLFGSSRIERVPVIYGLAIWRPGALNALAVLNTATFVQNIVANKSRTIVTRPFLFM
jgi:hypothetical protein